ncbi:Dinitrogenase reductase ADP-ribosyltransferase (DRAT) [Burkholderiales bacterium JOSHI_001]|nr:Dinitrogenase reductase ADP-ribosyltransferase (DRAT) [Burkholderiales bacterium JOSHI_001]
MTDEPHPARWHSTNLVGVPGPVLAAVSFNAHPVPLSIAGARAVHGGLFALLARAEDMAQAREMFGHYMSLSFGLAPDEGARSATERRRWRTSYRKLLQGWGLDANGAAGAVFKGWVESRFGLAPWFHKAPLVRFPSPAWVGYMEEKASARWNNNSIWQQLDLLYEFSQWMLRRFPALLPQREGPHVRLWRGSTQVEEQLVAGSLRQRHCTVRLNSVVSFAVTREAAECFGDWIFEALVPLAKVVVAPGVLDAPLLQGEGEVIALGGDYEVKASYGC